MDSLFERDREHVGNNSPFEGARGMYRQKVPLSSLCPAEKNFFVYINL